MRVLQQINLPKRRTRLDTEPIPNHACSASFDKLACRNERKDTRMAHRDPWRLCMRSA